MKNWMKVLGLGAVLATAGAAHAQPATPPALGTTVSTSTTTTTAAGTPDTTVAVGAEDAGTMPKTGGEPLLMMLGGGLTSLGALFLRRKLR
jgi:LPXTG-motif cell wall-anchored protein